MEYGFVDFLGLLGALGFFIYGMKIMSEGIQKAAGEKLRHILSAMTQNRLFGIFTGFLITAIIQSSSATTVMTVSFVNAGLLSLMESIGVIMGANIGTTITAWLISIFGFGKVSIAAMSLPIIAFGFPLMFSSKNQLKSIGEILIGFAILFMGLDALKHAVPDIKSNPEMLEFLGSYINGGVFSTILFVGIGTIVTIIVQSSSAAMALTLTLLFNGVINFEIAAAMVLGENVGTTITANIAALVANVHAKRAARAHLIFNLFGVLWMIILFPVFIRFVQSLWEPFQSFVTSVNSDIGKSNEEMQLALFHTLFNIINVLALVMFVPFIAKIVKRMVQPKGEEDEVFRLDFIGNSFVHTPELGILEAKKEIVKFSQTVSKMSKFTRDLLLSPDAKKSQRILKKIRNYEEITDRLDEEITAYLLKLSAGEMSDTSSKRVRAMISITTDLEQMGDLFYLMSKEVERKNKEKLWFTPEQRNRLLEIIELVDEAFEIMIENLEKNPEDVLLTRANEAEERINKKRNKMRKEHVKNIELGEYNVKSGIIYTNLFSSCEKVGDHIINVSEALKGEF